jgi:hypothetical protein
MAMGLRPAFAALLMTMLAASDLAAQPAAKPVENITVTGARTRQAIEGFVQSLATPTRATGKAARWEDGVCPVLVGLKHQFATFITLRVKDVAAQVGAPVNTKAGCIPNIAIVFTTRPQGLLDSMKKKQPGLLGYYDTLAQRDQLATVTHPIQAWYTTATRDLRGAIQVDSGRTLGQGLEIYLPCPEQGGGGSGMCILHLSNSRAAAVTGTRLGDGTRSELYDVVIVANPDRLVEYEMGPLADYIAMLALAQIGSPDACQPLASILNLLVANCANPPNALTDNDLGYLTALYKMSPDRTVQVQRNEMAYQMQQSLAGH